MEDFMALDSATCAENYNLSAAEAYKASSGFLGFINSFNYYFAATAPVFIIAKWVIGGFFTFGIWWILGYPAALIEAAIVVPVAVVLLYFPNMVGIVRWRLHQMTGYYNCAIGETGFTAEGYEELLRAETWIFAALDNHAIFADIPFNELFNNGGLIKDVSALILEYAPTAVEA